MTGAWLDELRRACRRDSQASVARRLGVSSAMVCHALKGTYPGNLDNLKARVEGLYLGRTVPCPVLGEVPLNECLDHQNRPFAATNPQRVRLWRACRACENGGSRC